MRIRSGGTLRRIAVRPPLALPGQRIGIMGGSFNPPHQGHLAVAEAALKKLALDRLWWLVTPGNPLKAHDGLAPLSDRVAACRRLARDRRMVVTGFEEDLGCSYTEGTLTFLKMRFPAVRFVWIMGGDNLATFHTWRGWRRIAESVPIAAVDRPGFRLKALVSPMARKYASARLPEDRAARLAARQAPAWTYLATRLSPLSSTALRSPRA